jgi:hypothetical protein
MEEPPAFTYVADMQAESENDAFKQVGLLFLDWKYRFCEEKADDFQPSDRFQ